MKSRRVESQNFSKYYVDTVRKAALLAPETVGAMSCAA
jgi:hypothetical protein